MNSWRWWPENNLPITGKWSNAIAKAAPSNKQNDIVAIVASSRYFSFVFLFVPKNTCPPTTSHVLHGNSIQDPVLPVDYQVKKSAFFFISEMPLQSTCFETQFYLTVFSSITYTTFHFEALCHSRKIPPKSFISSSLCCSIAMIKHLKLSVTITASAYFHISPSYYLFPFCLRIFLHSENPFSISNWLAIEFYLNYPQVFSMLAPSKEPCFSFCSKTSVTAATLLHLLLYWVCFLLAQLELCCFSPTFSFPTSFSFLHLFSSSPLKSQPPPPPLAS